MANIQRAVLVDTPPAAAYRLWKAFSGYPAFFEQLTALEQTGPATFLWQSADDVAPWTIRVTEDLPDRLIRWRSDGGRERECLVTFSPLEGNACWMVFNIEVETADGEVNLAELLAEAERRVQRTLNRARTLIESHYHSEAGGCAKA